MMRLVADGLRSAESSQSSGSSFIIWKSDVSFDHWFKLLMDSNSSTTTWKSNDICEKGRIMNTTFLLQMILFHNDHISTKLFFNINVYSRLYIFLLQKNFNSCQVCLQNGLLIRKSRFSFLSNYLWTYLYCVGQTKWKIACWKRQEGQRK